MGCNDFMKILNGCGGVEDCMLVLWYYGVNYGCIMLNEFVWIMLMNVV